MAFVGSLSGSVGTIAVTGSLVPGSATFDLGSDSSKWRNVYASSITGSIQKTGAGDNFIVAGPNVTANYNGLGQWEITASSGGGGGGAGVFTEASATAAFTTSSIAVGFGAAASTKGSDVFFAVSGSNTSSNTALFSGPIVTSGSFAVKDLANGNTVASITNAGAISGSALQTVGNLAVQGTSALIGDVTVTGDVAVNGGDITTSAGTFNIAASAATVNVGSSTGVVVIPGDLEVRGTTMTVSASNLVIEDPLVGFGFLSGSTAIGTGDRGFIGGITGTGNNVAFGWSNSNSAFVATRTTSSPEDATITVSALQPIRASKLEVNGTSAYVTSSAGTDLTVYAEGGAIFKSNTAKVFIDGASEQGIEFDIGGVTFAEFKNTGSDARFGAAPTKALIISGTTITLDTNAATNFTRNGARVGQLIGTSGAEFKLAANNSTGGATLLVLSGSSVDLSANSSGINLKFADNTRGAIGFGSNTLQFGANPGVALLLSGSTVTANAGAGGFVFQRDGVAELHVNASGSTTTISGSDLQNVILAAGTGVTTLALSGSTVNNQATIAHRFNLGGTLISHVTASDGRQGFFPGADSTFDLGGPSIRWANIYTGDLHLRNERGSYTLIEESDFLSIRFNKNGKRYKFLLERVPELDES